MAQKQNCNQNTAISKFSCNEKDVFKDEVGTEYTFERSNYQTCEVIIAQDKVQFTMGLTGSIKPIKLELEGFGWYYPMQFELPDTFKGWFNNLTPSTLLPWAQKLIAEYREFTQEMKEAAE